MSSDTVSSIEAEADGNKPLVVVAGFGAAGACAAIAAAQAGARVLVCDRAPQKDRGGNTRPNLFYMAMDGEDQVAEWLLPWLDKAASPWSDAFTGMGETAKFRGLDKEFVATWLGDASTTVKWLRSLGLNFVLSESDVADDGVLLGLRPTCGGSGMLDLLEEKARELGVAFTYETALEGIETDGAGRVIGVMLDTPAGRRSLACGALVLATGNIQGNHDLLSLYVGPRAFYTVPMSRHGYYNRGEGIVLARDLGAEIVGDLCNWHCMAIDARADGERMFMTGHDLGIMVNLNGVRFCDEVGGEVELKKMVDQPDGLVFHISDASALRHPFAERRFDSRQQPIQANSVEELAELIGVPKESLARTIETYNEACLADGTMAHDAEIKRSSCANPLVEMPLMAWPLRPTICFTYGGLRIDGEGRVLGASRRPIQGLYAAGDTAGGYYHDYPFYSSSIKAVVFGRRSGAHAAALNS